MPSRQSLWYYSHTLSIFSAVLLFTAGFLCVLLWTNDIVHTDTSSTGSITSTFTSQSPAVSTFSITYNVAIFGAAWNSILFVTLIILERDALPLSTERLRFEVEKAATTVTITGNAVYSVACMALMAVLARLAADASNPDSNSDPRVVKAVASSAGARRAGQGVTAAMAGLAAATAVWACFMDSLHMHSSRHRRNLQEVVSDGDEAIKQA